ncbi:hypothetical protein LCGC14_0941990 [marine sediment metagenome]|uniref:Uncharacterized protein n=1 Tax=marine sediment metagenome TaxID=412755 RepID=A0A0F9NJW7_9ZZZZ
MAIPTDKIRQLEEALDALAKSLNPDSLGRRGSILTDVCVKCNAAATEFTNELSRKEYTISGMCQLCQNEMFGAD